VKSRGLEQEPGAEQLASTVELSFTGASASAIEMRERVLIAFPRARQQRCRRKFA